MGSFALSSQPHPQPPHLLFLAVQWLQPWQPLRKYLGPCNFASVLISCSINTDWLSVPIGACTQLGIIWYTRFSCPGLLLCALSLLSASHPVCVSTHTGQGLWMTVMVEPVKLPDLKYISANVGDALIWGGGGGERERERMNVKLMVWESIGENCSRKSFLLFLKWHPYEWFEYMLALKMMLKVRLHIPSLKVLINLSFMTIH